MSVDFRPMRDDEAPAVVAMVQGLAQHVGGHVKPKLTAEKLIAARDLIDVVVAEEKGVVLGACLGLLTFSTWRGVKGLYVVDLFVLPQARGRKLGETLLRLSAARAKGRGAAFIKLEVDVVNQGAERFYARLGLAKKDEDRLHILEQDRLEKFIQSGG